MMCPTKLNIKCFCFASEVDLKACLILLTPNCGKLLNCKPHKSC